MKRFYGILASLALVVSAVATFGFLGADARADLPRDCDNNSIIKCGGTTAGELADKYAKNETGDLPSVYGSYGLNANDMAHADMAAKMGEVKKDGSVVVNGEVVATDAMSIGRQNIFTGSTTKNIGGKTYYETPPSRSFARDSIAAYVFFDQAGNFKSAVLTSCGNPVSAKPKPKPVYKCDNLAATLISRNEYSFKGGASAAGGATVVGYTLDFGDGTKQTLQNVTDITHAYAKAGTYTAHLTATIKVNGQDKTISGPDCAVKVTVAPEECKPGVPVGDEKCKEQPKECKPGIPEGDERCTPCPIPGKEQYPKDDTVNCVAAPVQELPKTGPTDLIFGGIGLSALAASGYYWYASRRGLLGALLNRS